MQRKCGGRVIEERNGGEASLSEIAISPVTGSSRITGLGYDPETRTMRIRFSDYYHKGDRKLIPGAVYDVSDVSDVSPEEFEAMMRAKSKVTHFFANFRNSNRVPARQV
jgi:hypothetical protein